MTNIVGYAERRELSGEDIYGEDEEIRSAGFDVPEWIDQDIAFGDAYGIAHYGCASGIYMPAVRYRSARDTMYHHASDVLGFIVDNLGELPAPEGPCPFVFYLSLAVELWAHQFGDIRIE